MGELTTKTRPFYYRTSRRKERELRSSPELTPFHTIVTQMLDQKGRTELHKKLFHLYNNWETALGYELASIALPIGRRKDILLIAAEDNYILSELVYLHDEILEKVHLFIGEVAFKKVETHLLQGKQALHIPFELHNKFEELELIRPENLGNLNLPNGKIRDAYLRYLALFSEQEHTI